MSIFLTLAFDEFWAMCSEILVCFLSELYFLIAKYLEVGPCQRAAEVSESYKPISFVEIEEMWQFSFVLQALREEIEENKVSEIILLRCHSLCPRVYHSQLNIFTIMITHSHVWIGHLTVTKICLKNVIEHVFVSFSSYQLELTGQGKNTSEVSKSLWATYFCHFLTKITGYGQNVIWGVRHGFWDIGTIF